MAAYRSVDKICSQEPEFDDPETYVDQHKHVRKRLAHTCDECGKGFITPSKLKRHSFVHMREKLHMCELCRLRFKSMDRLKRHSVIHSEQKAFDCPECNKRFTTLDRLKAHSLVRHSCAIYAVRDLIITQL
jgi:uncharacterized Zn-finger protein